MRGEVRACKLPRIDGRFYTLQSFKERIKGHTVLIRMYNVSAVTYINKLGGGGGEVPEFGRASKGLLELLSRA